VNSIDQLLSYCSSMKKILFFVSLGAVVCSSLKFTKFEYPSSVWAIFGVSCHAAGRSPSRCSFFNFARQSRSGVYFSRRFALVVRWFMILPLRFILICVQCLMEQWPRIFISRVNEHSVSSFQACLSQKLILSPCELVSREMQSLFFPPLRSAQIMFPSD
jgi:hypothetical protein